mmetsp:Transcript_38149/g.95869  ORF Transcript_38149/g.95869 Transcript_38149/m.95869 type:complete len:170 (+) Transcript_38149:312-821(+)
MGSVKEFFRHCMLWAPVGLYINSEYFRIDRVVGTSMRPTLNLHSSSGGEFVLSNLLSRTYHMYRPGDIVILKSPENPQQRLVKRLVAVQGQTVRISDQRGNITVPQGHCWVEGDNPYSSRDSASKYGPIPTGLILGTVSAVVWPPSRMRLVHSLPAPARRHAEPVASQE